MERSVELADDLVPDKLALGDFIEVLLHIGSEIISENAVEVLHQVVGDYHTYLLRQQFALFCADGLDFLNFADDVVLHGQASDRNLLALLIALGDIAASRSKSRDGWGICRRTANADFLHFLDESGF